eukprot:6645506-Lingulodinium_polyedra.AAC.1
MVLPATFQDEEDQRCALARAGSDPPTNALHVWLVIGAPITILLTIVPFPVKFLRLTFPVQMLREGSK